MTTPDIGRTAYEARFAGESRITPWADLPEQARAVWRRVEAACTPDTHPPSPDPRTEMAIPAGRRLVPEDVTGRDWAAIKADSFLRRVASAEMELADDIAEMLREAHAVGHMEGWDRRRQQEKSAAPAPAEGAQSGDGWLTLRALQAANVARQAEWCPDQLPDLSFRGNELAGETGEACNVIKKLERERHGWRGSRATKQDLAEELADVVICASLCAVTAGIDLETAVVAKFDATSEKQGLATRLDRQSPPRASEG